MIRIRTFAFLDGMGALALFCASLAVPVSVSAQDSLPKTPPGLEDFRLDKPPPREETPELKSQPVPQPQPSEEAPSQSQSPSKSQAPSQVQAKPSAPRAEAEPARVQRTGETTLPADGAAAVPEAATDAGPLTPPPLIPSVETEDGPAASPIASVDGNWPQIISFWPLLAAAFALLAGFFLFRMMRQRATQDAVALAGAAPKVAPAATADVAPLRNRPTAQPAPLPPQAMVKAHFEPGDVRLSLANLTIGGTLHLHNSSTLPITNLTLRTAIMSACDGQAALIDAFHRDIAQGDKQALGPLVPGEKIDVKLEMQIPREALQEFDWRDRRFVAPIMLVNISSDDPAMAPCRLSCVVGQVGKPESSRLTPIPIDRGPRRFAAVQIQPIAA